MFGKKFGHTEAARAGRFASTEEQKRTVLAVVEMFGIPIEVAGQCKKIATKLGGKITARKAEIERLNKVVRTVERANDADVNTRTNIEKTASEWDLSPENKL